MPQILLRRLNAWADARFARRRLILQDQRVFFQPLLRAEKRQREKKQKIMLSPHGMLDVLPKVRVTRYAGERI